MAIYRSYRLEAPGDVISSRFVRPTVLYKFIKFRDTGLKRSQEIPPKAVGGGIFNSFFAIILDRR